MQTLLKRDVMRFQRCAHCLLGAGDSKRVMAVSLVMAALVAGTAAASVDGLERDLEAASTLGMSYSPPSLFGQKTIRGPFQGNRLDHLELGA